MCITTSPGGGWWVVGGWWVLDFTRLMLISTQVEVVVGVGVELGNVGHVFDRVWQKSKYRISRPSVLVFLVSTYMIQITRV